MSNIMYCQQCDAEIKDEYYVCKDNFMVIKYLYDTENVFCSQECFCDYCSLEIEFKDERKE